MFVTMALALACLCLGAVIAKGSGLEYSQFQQRVLATSEDHDLFLGGGRGGTKSFTELLLAWRHAEQYGQSARILYLRQSYLGIADFEQMTRELFGKVYGSAASYNSNNHVWRFPNDAYFELGQLEGPQDYGKYQGRSFSLLLIDEAAQWPEPRFLDLLRSNLRGPSGTPVRVVIAANPGGPGHHWLAQRYVFKAAPWTVFREDTSGRDFMYCPSTYADNPFIDRANYRAQIEASTSFDPELGRAWLEGDWTVVRGAYFAGCLSEERNAVASWPTPEESPEWWWEARRGTHYRKVASHRWEHWMGIPINPRPHIADDWRLFLAGDYGSARPGVYYVCAESSGSHGPDDRWYPPNSLVLLDELATVRPGTLNEGMGYTIPRVAEEIKAMAARWGMSPSGVLDDACFAVHGHSAGSIAEEFEHQGVHFRKSRKADRLSGWERMRRMLADAGKPDCPGLYITRGCTYFWQTAPFLDRDPRRVEDLNTAAADHAADAVRYACLQVSWTRPESRR